MPETSDFQYPPTFEGVEMLVSGRIKGEPWGNNIGRTRLIPLLTKAKDEWHWQHASSVDSPAEFIEVGSWVGGNAYRIAKSIPRTHIYCIDHWRGSESDHTALIAGELGPQRLFQTFCRNMGDLLFNRVFPCVGSSETWASIWPRQVAAIFIDAGHDYESVSADLHNWWPHVLPGGLFIGHDYEAFAEVKQAVADWHKPEYGALETDEELWWVWKQ